MPVSLAEPPQPVPESILPAATTMPQRTVPPPAPLGASVQEAPAGLGGLQMAMSGAQMELVRPVALLP